jgi:hypothetical protein
MHRRYRRGNHTMSSVDLLADIELAQMGLYAVGAVGLGLGLYWVYSSIKNAVSSASITNPYTQGSEGLPWPQSATQGTMSGNSTPIPVPFTS